MRPRRPAGPSRRLIGLLLAITVVPLVSLLWLGWYLVAEDREIALNRSKEQLDLAAGLVTSALERAIALDDQRAAAGAGDWPAGAVVVTFTAGHIAAVPRRLAYYPVAVTLPEASPDVFDGVDRAEFQLRDSRRQVDLLERLLMVPEPAIAATARFRLARTFQSLGQHERAMQMSAGLLDNDRIGVANVPVALIARYSRCQWLDARGDKARLRGEADALRSDLMRGRWALTAPVYGLYLKDAMSWLGATAPGPSEEERLAQAVIALWPDRHLHIDRPAGVPPRQSLIVGPEVFTVLWQPRPGGARALIATSEYVQAHWISRATEVGRNEQVAIEIIAQADEPSRATPDLQVRAATTTGLPWDVGVSRSVGATVPAGTARRPYLFAGLAILILMAIAASYFIARSVHREIAVARMQSDFVAAVSHEFRTPLTTLRQFTEMLREGTAGDEERRQLCYEAQSRATDRLTNLVESVLDFGRMEAGKRPYRFEPVTCAHVVGAVVVDFQREIEAAGYRIHLHADESIEVDADSEALGRALRNLLENAVKYSPTEHIVEVDVSRRAADVAIAVRDRGIGVAPGERKAIFDQFHRGAEARTRGIAGTGIGLAMVDHIVRAHRGRVDVESELGRGSTFTIVLPART